MTESFVNKNNKSQFRNRFLTNENDVFKHNAWDDVKWDKDQEKLASKKVEENSSVKLSEEEREKFDKNADEYWDAFYGIHQNKFFKDRNWLFTEFPELDIDRHLSASATIEKTNKITIFEIGCGVGNTIFPILQNTSNKNLFLYGCDFSKTAINIVRNNSLYDEKHCLCFESDITSFEWNAPFKENSLDVVIMIFVLSSINPKKYSHVIKRVKTYLKPGGQVLFRDYGRYDMAQVRFKVGRCLSDNFYVRGDGTSVYFFSQDEISKLFTSEGFLEEQNLIDRRLQVNREKLLKMYRVWIQAKYRKPW